MSSNRISVDILIAGAGIAGSALACALRVSGLSVMVLEKSGAALDTARGDHLRPRTVELLERWGVLQNFLAAGAEKRRASRWFTNSGELLFESTFDELDVPHPYYLYLNHELIGEVMLRAALEDGRIRLERPIRNFWLERNDASGVAVRVGLPGGDELTVEAALMVGADGRNSRLRKTCDIPTHVHNYARPIAVYFAKQHGRGATNPLDVHLGERFMTVVIPRMGGDCKIGVPVDADLGRQLRSAEEDQQFELLAGVFPDLPVSDIRFADLYPPVYLRTDTWVSNNAVLLGDACHAMHPARSQGMNTSLDCVAELATVLRARPLPLQPTSVNELLTDYERRVKPRIDAQLEKNHAHGIEMDAAGAEAYRASCAALRGLSANQHAKRAFAANAAGYPNTG
ncbi:MAG: NAD(P)/FAD-dependent oxidoreductase [Pseudomonadota bacterium]